MKAWAHGRGAGSGRLLEREEGPESITSRDVRGLVGRCLSLNRKQVLGLAFLMRKRSGEEGRGMHREVDT